MKVVVGCESDGMKPIKDIMINKQYMRPPNPATFYDVCAKRTHFPIKNGCPFKLGNIIRCLDYHVDCITCIKMYAYCRNLTGVGRI